VCNSATATSEDADVANRFTPEQLHHKIKTDTARDEGLYTLEVENEFASQQVREGD